MTKLRIAVVGAGLIGRRHIELVLTSPSCMLSAIVDPAPSAEALATRVGVPHFTTLEEFLSAQRPDGVILATPNQLHAAQTLQLVEAGIPVLVEKPLAHTLEEGERLVKVIEDSNATVLVGHHRAHNPILQKAKELIDQGILGRIVAVMGSALFYKPDAYFEAAPWRRQPGSGPILLNMIHDVHTFRMLCGEIVEVQAFASSTTRGFSVEDTAAIILRFACGALGTFLLSDTAASPKSWEQTSQENPSYPTYPDEDCYIIAGTMGSLGIPTMRLWLYEEEIRSWWKPFNVSRVEVRQCDPLQRQLEHFCAVLRGEAQPLVDAREGLKNLRVIDAILEAARSGKAIGIPLHEQQTVSENK